MSNLLRALGLVGMYLFGGAACLLLFGYILVKVHKGLIKILIWLGVTYEVEEKAYVVTILLALWIGLSVIIHIINPNIP